MELFVPFRAATAEVHLDSTDFFDCIHSYSVHLNFAPFAHTICLHVRAYLDHDKS